MKPSLGGPDFRRAVLVFSRLNLVSESPLHLAS
jgi:hypothetical protein